MVDHCTVANRMLICNVCGKLILSGERCRIVHDDFMKGLVYFEHIACPRPEPKTNNNNTKKG